MPSGQCPHSEDPSPWDSVSIDLRESLAEFEPYLRAIAARELDAELRSKASDEDLVQQTLLDAHRELENFTGDNDRQVKAWLRRILLNNIASLRRQYFSQKRQVGRETNEELDAIRSPGKTPSSLLSKQEEIQLLEAALRQLSDEYQQVIQWRSLERLPFEEIGAKLERSPDAARKLWFRAMQKLRATFKLLRSQPGRDDESG